jgi:hypothetical protein
MSGRYDSMRRVNLGEVAVLDGRGPALPVHPPYKNRGEALKRNAEQPRPAPKRYAGVFYLVAEGKRLSNAWRIRLSESNWETIGKEGVVLRLYDTETGEERRVRVVTVCLTRSPKRLEVQIDASEGEPGVLLPVERAVAK